MRYYRETDANDVVECNEEEWAADTRWAKRVKIRHWSGATDLPCREFLARFVGKEDNLYEIVQVVQGSYRAKEDFVGQWSTRDETELALGSLTRELLNQAMINYTATPKS